MGTCASAPESNQPGSGKRHHNVTEHQRHDNRGRPLPDPHRSDEGRQDKPDQHRSDGRHRAIPDVANSPRRGRHNDAEPVAEKNIDEEDAFINEDKPIETILKGIPFETIINKCNQQPKVKDMENAQDKNSIFMIRPWKYDQSRPDREPKPINDENTYKDYWDEYHVHMPCSQKFLSKKKESKWNKICSRLLHLKQKCDQHTATFEDLKETIESCNDRQYDMGCLEKLIYQNYSDVERTNFMFKTLSKICDLTLTVTTVCTQPPPLLRIGSNSSVTMSQRQVASLLACAFFCLFPFRSDQDKTKEYEKYPNPNFERLYQGANPQKIEKLKCILNYFRRVTENMPTGVITFRRFALPNKCFPPWNQSKTELCDLHLTTGRKIEEVDFTLQVDFANKYIGGGVLGSGCVQEEIRFTICPEMLVSLLVCEVMEPNECIFLIGCERYSSYKGYAGSFKFDGNYDDRTIKDDWGRKWCYLVAMDAIFFRNPPIQYQMENVERELLKAYTSFRPQEQEPTSACPITTGNWGCGAFNGDRQLKAIIQLMAASEAQRPLIYAAYGDKKLVNSFSQIYDHLKKQRATVGDLYNYLQQYSREHHQYTLFEYILQNPVSERRY